MLRKFIGSLVCLTVLACGTVEEDLSEAPMPLGQFRLGHNIAIADNVTKGQFSSEFTDIQIEVAVQNQVAQRLRRYDGDGLYHLGIVVGGIVLAQPGVPIVYAPKPVMILDVTVFDNATQEKLNAEPKRIFAGEGMRNAVPFLGSGNVRSVELQLENLSASTAREIESWLRENPDWFTTREGQIRVPYDADVNVPKIDTTSIQDINNAAAGN
jgi:hypothetical protein